MTGINRDVVRYRDENGGREMMIELSTGKVFDLAGNTIANWTPADNDWTPMVADYVAELSYETLAASLGKSIALGSDRQAHERDREARIESVRSHIAMMRDEGMGGRHVKMDLGISDVNQPRPINFASGYRNEQPMADVIAPPFLQNVPAGKYYQYAKEDAFQRALPIVGAGGAQVPEIAPRLANANFSSTEYALGGFVSTQLEAAADAPLRVRQATARRIKTVLDLEREIRVANLFGASALDSSVTATIASGSQWNGGASSSPIADLLTREEKSWGAATAIMMGGQVWNAFVQNPAVQKYFTYKPTVSGIPSIDQVRSEFSLPPIYVAKMKYINTSGGLSYVWGNNVIMFRQPEQMPPTSQDDVMSAVTFRWNIPNAPDGVTNNGWTVREYYVQDRGSMGGTKLVMIHHDGEVITSTFVGGMLVNAYQLSLSSRRAAARCLSSIATRVTLIKEGNGYLHGNEKRSERAHRPRWPTGWRNHARSSRRPETRRHAWPDPHADGWRHGHARRSTGRQEEVRRAQEGLDHRPVAKRWRVPRRRHARVDRKPSRSVRQERRH